MKPLDSLLVDGAVLDRYLNRLAENTAQLLSRLQACEQHYDRLQDEIVQLRNGSIQTERKIDDHENRLAVIQKQLDSGKGKLGSSRSGFTAGTGMKVPIEGDFYNDYLKWKAKAGDVVKKGQVVAVCCMSKNMVIEYGSIGAPADGVFLDKSFPDGANLHGKNMVIGHIET